MSLHVRRVIVITAVVSILSSAALAQILEQPWFARRGNQSHAARW